MYFYFFLFNGPAGPRSFIGGFFPRRERGGEAPEFYSLLSMIISLRPLRVRAVSGEFKYLFTSSLLLLFSFFLLFTICFEGMRGRSPLFYIFYIYLKIQYINKITYLHINFLYVFFLYSGIFEIFVDGVYGNLIFGYFLNVILGYFWVYFLNFLKIFEIFENFGYQFFITNLGIF